MNLTRRSQLTPEQRHAVEIKSQDVVVLANPGGGKTALLVERIHHLIETLQVPPESIMVLTFTSKAATELRQRVHKRVGVTSKAMWIRTFHSAGLQLLKTFPTVVGLRDDFTILDAGERKELLRRFVLTQHRYRYLSDDELVDHITKVKNGMVLLSDLPSDIQMAMDLYERVMREQNAIDLDDMVMKAVDVLKNQAIRYQIHKRFHHILIDEYQDINAMQERLVLQMLGPQASRYLVGDPDQTIYEWRGAKPEYMMAHSKKADLIQLTKNFRSSTSIVKLANHIIEQNASRNRMPMEAMGNDMYVPVVGRFENEIAQAEFIAKQIKQLVDEKRFRFSDIAILIRSHTQTPVLEEALSDADIPHGGELFWSQPAVLNALSLLEAVRQPYRNGNLAKAVNIPTRIMDNLRLQELAKEYEIQHLSTADQLLVLSHLPGEWLHHHTFRKRLNTLLALHKESHYQTSALLISQLIASLELRDDPDSKSNQLSLYTASKKLLDLALSFETSHTGASLRDFLHHINKLRAEAQVPGHPQGNVQILTCHHSKGLEFPVVFVIGVQLGIFPNDFFVDTEDDLEAERRLFYVAITRAKKALFLTAYHDPEWQPSKPDYELRSFLDSIPSSLAQEMY